MRATGTWRRQGNTIIVFDSDTRALSKATADAESFELESQSAKPTIRKGSSGASVREAQSRLKTLGFDPGPIDGDFGPQTDAAARSFQRARGLTADGIVGPSTWAALYSSASPSPRQPTRAPSTSPAPPAPAGGAAAPIIAEARKHLGFQEGPNNTNPFSTFFGVPNVAWCAYFVSYAHTKAGIPLNQGSCSALLDMLADSGRFFTSPPQPGDIVFFDWTLGDDDETEHVGLVERTYRNSSGQLRVVTIEGNTSSTGVVKNNDWDANSANIVGYGRLT